VNQLDALLLVLLAPFALRGYWRGFCRESFGLAGTLGGLVAAAAGGSRVAAVLVARELLSPAAAGPAAFVAVFVVVVVAANLLGALADGLARALFLGGVNRAAGVIFGSAKGAAVLGVGLLAVERLVVSPALAELVAHSTLARPLARFAAGVLATGRDLAAAAEGKA
jgi:membrane protein required for colicin V production